jgi:hypothetical protein
MRLIGAAGGFFLIAAAFLLFGLSSIQTGTTQAETRMGSGETSTSSSSSTSSESSTSLQPNSDCGGNLKVEYYAQDKVREHNLGTPVSEKSDARKAFDEIAMTDCHEPYLLASHYVDMGWTESAEVGAINRLAGQYKADSNLMRGHFTQWKDWWTNPNTTLTIEDIPGPYASDYGVAGADQMTIEVKRDDSVQPTSGYKMLVGRNGDVVKMISLECKQALHLGEAMPNRIPPTPQGNGGPPPPTHNTTTPPTGTGGNCADTGMCSTTTTKPPCTPGNQQNDCPKHSAPQPTGVTSPPRSNDPTLEPEPTISGPTLTPGDPTTTTTTSVPPNPGGDNDGEVGGR